MYNLQDRPALSVWHQVNLDEEFTTDSHISHFSEYLAIEERLFAQLNEEVYARVPTGNDHKINRYSRGSLADPARWPRNWNRSFELTTEEPEAGVLLLHGLSDSPYSLRALGETLRNAGASVLGLRIPGHGTAPAGLLRARWQDMAAAVRLAARHLQTEIADKPLYVVGYSNGGALAIDYSLATLADPSLPRPTGVILLSPQIGVTPLAFLASWQGRLGYMLGLEKLAWNTIEPEYDPFKYNSFAINAGDIAHRLTNRIQSQLAKLEDKLLEMPRILVFQSGADATVSAPAVVEHLFNRLPQNGHELVLFDVNRNASITSLLSNDPADAFGPILDTPGRGFDLTIVTNGNGSQVIARRQTSDGATSETVLDTVWPPGVYSLTHIALPFAPEDPVYGGPDAAPSPGVQLGNIALRGERGVLAVSGDTQLRMHWNPFYDHLETRIVEFMASLQD